MPVPNREQPRFAGRQAGLRTAQRKRRARAPIAAGAAASAFALACGAVAASHAADIPPAMDTLPSIEQLEDYKPEAESRVYADDGSLIGRFGINRTFVRYEDIPKRVVNAFVAAEDQRFFEHAGVDPRALARAAITNIVSDDLVGGSTITQQVAKTFLLSNDRTMDRKIKEMFLAMRIEGALSKARILELYLNQIYLGAGAYGVAAAAERYFGKPLDALTVAEAAMLAALPKAPSRTNPIEDPLQAMQRRDYVIERMREDGYITDIEARAARQASYTLPTDADATDPGARHFVEEVRRSMIARYGQTRWSEGGFEIRTSLNRKLQRHANAALRDGLIAFDRRHGYRGPVASLAAKAGDAWRAGWADRLAQIEKPAGARDWKLAVVLDAGAREAEIGFADGTRGRIPLAEVKWARKQGKRRVGETVALEPVGRWIGHTRHVFAPGDVILVEARARSAEGKDYPKGTYTLRQVPKVTGALVALDPWTGRVVALVGGYSFERSQYNMATQARRQPGSAFKPLVYLAALEQGFTPSTLVRDSAVTLTTRWGKSYTPANYDDKFYGPMTMRRALELSRNVATIRLSRRVGLEKIAALARRVGVVDAVSPVLSMALGAYETTPLRMATGYATIANGGLRVRASLTDRIRDRHGRVLFRGRRPDCDTCVADRRGGIGLVDAAATNAEERDRARHAERVVTAQSAYQVTQMMRGVILRGTGRAVAGLDKPLAGKTGTTNDMVDAWFVGFSPDLVVTVWVGYEQRLSLGAREQGGVTAAPIFKAFMKKALADREVRDFRKPAGLVPLRVSLHSGLPAEHGRVITEYFKPGQEPKPWGAYAPDEGRFVARRSDEPTDDEPGRDETETAELERDLRNDVTVVRGNRENRRSRERRTRDWVETRDREMDLYGR